MTTEGIAYSYIYKTTPERVRTDTASVLERRDGSLLAVYHSYSAGPKGGNDFGAAKIYSAVSEDGGMTWTRERMIGDIAPGDLNVMSPYLCQADDEILMGYVRNHTKGDTSMLLHRSEDDGESFSEPTFIWNHVGEYRLQGGASSLVRLADGRLVLPFQSVDEVWVPNENERVGSYVSDDGGHTWTESKNHVYLPLRGAMEPSLAEVPDGRLVMSLRTQLGAVFLTYSEDRGESWSLAETTGLRSPESCTCLRLVPGTGDLLLFWNDARYLPDHHHYGIRTPLSAALSKDGGKTWRKVGNVDRGDYMFTNLGCTMLSNGSAVVTYLEKKDPEITDEEYLDPHVTVEEKEHDYSMDLKVAVISPSWWQAKASS